MIKCIVVDDEQLARKLLEGYIDKLPQLELVKSCKNPLEAISILQKEEIHLMFLDIQMPDLLGTELLKVLPKKPVVIFTTAYKEYALEGYQLDVIDYMLKPIKFERFVQGVNKAINFIQLKDQKSSSGNQPSGSITSTNNSKPKTYITLKADHKILKVNFSEIYFIEGLREYLAFHTEKEKIVTLESFKNLESILPNDQFIRIHKSFIVNKEKVKALYGNQIEIKDQYIPIGKVYKKDVLENIFQ